MSQIKFEPLQISSFGDEALAVLDASFRSKEVFEIGGKLFSLSGVSHHWTGASIGRVSAVADHVSVPANPAWNGEGLPPVGAVCEFAGGTHCPEDPFDKDLKEGMKVTIIAHFKCGDFTLAAFTFDPENPDRGMVQVEQANFGCFRPIRTPEQIAAEEREKAIRQMIDDTNILTGIMRDRRIMAGQLYDAGYRKFEIVENEE